MNIRKIKIYVYNEREDTIDDIRFYVMERFEELEGLINRYRQDTNEKGEIHIEIHGIEKENEKR